MNIALVRDILLWCAILNFGVLLLWFLVFRWSRRRIHRLHGRWFRLTPEQFDAIHYAGMAIYKIGIILLNLVPYLALRILT